MIQDLYQKAMKFAGERHATQTMPDSSTNYLLHLSNVAMEILLTYANNNNFDIELAIQVAILHDTLEDTDTSFAEIKEKFGERVALAVLALTKDKTLPDKATQMQDSLDKIKQVEREAGMVKLADRITNLQEPPAHWDLEKTRTYWEEAKLILDSLRHTHAYLSQRLEEKIVAYERFI